MYIDIGAVLGGLGVIFGILMTVLNYRRNSSKDIQERAAGDGELSTNIEYIKRGVEDIRVDLKAQEKRHNDLSERVTRVEESAKSAHKRLDSLET